ncbi:uncharacterized protein [Fopius arisanus]|uniref:Uncharacterized protein n=1 Tax=Fopius arisanus TaxID=64838 RepID=A0A9R1U7Q7_9HYME|nr:PREDICTED: uncharacterized protein LOC105271593 [Fopius arisanus]
MESINPENFSICEEKNISASNNPSCSKTKDEAVDENSNVIELMEEQPTPGDCVLSLLPGITTLKIESPGIYHVFGKVENIIESMHLALVQATSNAVFLDIDTPVFVVLPSSLEDDSNPEYVLLGEVDDVFGPVGSPTYSVKLMGSIDKSNLIDSFVYLLSNHPNTNLLRVESTRDKKYNIVSAQRFYDA